MLHLLLFDKIEHTEPTLEAEKFEGDRIHTVMAVYLLELFGRGHVVVDKKMLGLGDTAGRFIADEADTVIGVEIPVLSQNGF